MAWLWIVVLAVVIGSSIAVLRKRLLKRGNELQQLCDNGRVVPATVVDVRKERRAKSLYNYYMSYSFKPFDGEVHSQEIPVNPSEFAHYVEGQEIEIVYLPEAPEIHALKPLIDQFRAARR